MIIAKIKAGLGNQMFQYACGRALSLRNGDELKLDTSDWSLGREKVRSYLLSNFNIVENIATDDELRKLKYPWGEFATKAIKKILSIMGNSKISFDPKIVTKKGDVYLDGYWQSEKYFVDHAAEIRDDLTLRNPLTSSAAKMLEKIQNEECPVSINIRRGWNITAPP